MGRVAKGANRKVPPLRSLAVGRHLRASRPSSQWVPCCFDRTWPRLGKPSASGKFVVPPEEISYENPSARELGFPSLYLAYDVQDFYPPRTTSIRTMRICANELLDTMPLYSCPVLPLLSVFTQSSSSFELRSQEIPSGLLACPLFTPYCLDQSLTFSASTASPVVQRMFEPALSGERRTHLLQCCTPAATNRAGRRPSWTHQIIAGLQEI